MRVIYVYTYAIKRSTQSKSAHFFFTNFYVFSMILFFCLQVNQILSRTSENRCTRHGHFPFRKSLQGEQDVQLALTLAIYYSVMLLHVYVLKWNCVVSELSNKTKNIFLFFHFPLLSSHWCKWLYVVWPLCSLYPLSFESLHHLPLILWKSFTKSFRCQSSAS
jgi:hypothetical protein